MELFEAAIAEIEARMGLSGQPRAFVFHEKEGPGGYRRHAHCVWSRIDTSQMKAINLPHFKLKLREISRQLFLEHGWQMPPGLQNSDDHNRLNYSQAECQQAKRVKRDPRELKRIFLDCWAASDSKAAYANALKDHGLILAKGDRRGHVAVDESGEVYAISRWTGINVKDVRARLGDANDLPSIDDAVELFNTK